MKHPFDSATFRLTSYYLLILFFISLFFSIMVYQVSVGEVERRLTRYQDRSWLLSQPIPNIPTLDHLRSAELDESKAAIIGILMYVNLFALSVGGALSYFLARHTLRPIEEAHDAQTRFVSDASHELRTPLAAMTTELEVALQDSSLTKQEMRTILISNLEEVQRLDKLSSMLLALSSGDKKSLPRRPFNIAEVLERSVGRLKQPSSRISLHVPKTSPRVVANPAAIEELLAILLDNALKYSPKNSTVTVASSPRDHRVEVRIANSGDGIAEEHLPHIFDRFYRADSARSHGSGYGLGLAMARQISDFNDANLAVTSIPGNVTEFTFSLPIFRKRKAKSKK